MTTSSNSSSAWLTTPKVGSFGDLEPPRLVALRPNLCMACFSLMKIRPATYILDRAEARGELEPGGTICESSSGTFGLALAMLGRARGYGVRLVASPLSVDQRLLDRLERLGASVEFVYDPAPVGGSQQARLDRLAEIIDDTPGAYWPRQYDNPDNPTAYHAVADYLLARLGRVDTLVGTVGTGGSMSGLAARLRQRQGSVNVVAVDAQHSATFGQVPQQRLLRGIGNSIVPGNVDHSAYDVVSWVGGIPGLAAARELESLHGVYMGGTSGAAYLVARWWATSHPTERVVAVGPDEGHRYIDSLWNDDWVTALPDWQWRPPSEPVWVDDPRNTDAPWTVFPWRRQTRTAVLAA